VPEGSPNQLVPLSSHALKTRLRALNFEWAGEHHTSAPIRDLCVLTSDLIAIGTDRGLTLWRGPREKSERPAPDQLKIHGELPLPSPVSTLLCEEGKIMILGEGFGLIELQ
jgi:hypothetical protein